MTIHHSIRIQSGDFDLSAELDALQRGDHGTGAICSFVGMVRDFAAGETVSAIEIEHYPGMTERALREIAEDCSQRFGLRGVTIVHRVGRLAPGERIVLVAAAAAHRRDAFQACEYAMDCLKTQAPFWKKESGPAGERWVEASRSDDDALARWGVASENAA